MSQKIPGNNLGETIMHISHGVEFSQNQALVIVQIRDYRNAKIKRLNTERINDMLKPFGLDLYNHNQFKKLPKGDGFKYAVVDLDLGKEIDNEYSGSIVVIVYMPGDFGVDEI